MEINKVTAKTIDVKTIAIIILGLVLIISFFFGQNSTINKHVDEIKALQEENSALVVKNDGLVAKNIKIDKVISQINNKIDNNSTQLLKTQVELIKLKNKKNEIPSYVNRLSANGVANEFTKYLDKRTESDSIRKR